MALFKWFSVRFNLHVLLNCGCIIVALQHCVVLQCLLHQFVFFSSGSW
uniref:Uncharacterized protein n=1 Tax=Physcomitrium patens TaxID=3218 RepID=A0A7I4CAR6_PHYPA